MFQLLVVLFIIKLYARSNIFKLTIIILNLRVGTSKNKNIDHRGKEASANEQPDLLSPRFNDVKYAKFSFFIYFIAA